MSRYISGYELSERGVLDGSTLYTMIHPRIGHTTTTLTWIVLLLAVAEVVDVVTVLKRLVQLPGYDGCTLISTRLVLVYRCVELLGCNVTRGALFSVLCIVAAARLWRNVLQLL